LETLFAGRGYDLQAMKARMADLMEAEGLSYGDRTMTYNSRLAQELAKWGETQPGGMAIHDALFRAYFVDGTNLADVDQLVRVAESIGLDVTGARRSLELRSFQHAVDTDWQRSRQLGVTGVPTFVAGNLAVVGAQPYEMLERLVMDAGGTLRSN